MDDVLLSLGDVAREVSVISTNDTHWLDVKDELTALMILASSLRGRIKVLVPDAGPQVDTPITRHEKKEEATPK